MFWYTIYPSIIEPSRRAHCLTKPFKNFKCLWTIHMDLECFGPHNSISSTWRMRECSCALKNDGGKYFCISHIRWGISLYQYLISSLWISLDEIHLQMMQENNSDPQDWSIYNKVPRCKTQYVNNLWNKEKKHFHAYKLLLTSCIYHDHT